MAKKKATKKKSAKKKKPVEVKSKGFGHLTILKNWQVKDSSSVDGGNYDGWDE